MSLQVENLEKNMAKLTVEVSVEEFESAVEKAYQKNKGKINIQGFRKGKAPRKMIEKMYGTGIFFEDAANSIIPTAYDKAAEESNLDIVSQPEINVVQIESGKPFIFTAEVAVKPQVILGEYKGIKVEKQTIEVTEEEINEEIDKVRDQNARMITIEDRPAQMGDETLIDFEGFVNGTAFDGGKGEDYALTLGTHTFIDTFEDQLVGKSIGEELEINVTFPVDYQVKELAGKPALFKVKIKEIKMKELPKLDDEFASEVSEFDTLDEYKEEVKATIVKNKEKTLKTAKEDAVVEIIIENATMDIPEPMIATQAKQMANEFAQRIQAQGLSVEQYFQFTGMDAEKFMETLKPQAIKRIQSRLVLEAIVKEEGITVSEEELEKLIADMATAYKMEVEKVKELLTDAQKEEMIMNFSVQKAVNLVADAAVEE